MVLLSAFLTGGPCGPGFSHLTVLYTSAGFSSAGVGFSPGAGKAGRDARLTPAARDTLSLHPWPGNVRQLRNVAEVVAYGEDEVIDARHIHEVLGDQERASSRTDFITIPECASLKQMESEIIRNLLAKHPAEEVCSRLGISRVTLWRKMKHMTIEAKTPRYSPPEPSPPAGLY